MEALALVSVLPVVVVWRTVFAQHGRGFWLAMAAVTAALGVLALALRAPGAWAWRLGPSQFAWAAVTAVALYGLFYVGDRVLLALAPSVPASGASVYTRAHGVSRLALTGVLLLVIGPGEELYWRGLVQWNLQHLLPAWGAVLGAAVLYAAVHLVTRSPALVLAALLGGLYWGGMYALTGNLPTVMLSHALWDCLALLWLPFPVPGGPSERGTAGVLAPSPTSHAREM